MLAPVQTSCMADINCNIVVLVKRCLSQEASGACNGGQLHAKRLVLSNMNVVLSLQLMNIRQNNIVPHRPRFATAVLSRYQNSLDVGMLRPNRKSVTLQDASPYWSHDLD